MSEKKLSALSSPSEVEAFLTKVPGSAHHHRPRAKGRLMFALDATASREHTWDQASDLQAQMFVETQQFGGLDVQLCWYRGFREYQYSPWVSDAVSLLEYMARVRCAGGQTQIQRILDHTIIQTRESGGVHALVFIGDCMEENMDTLCDRAGQLGLLGVPVFVFQEGSNALAEQAFRAIARLSKGAYCRFDAASIDELRKLLAAVAVYTSGGYSALTDFAKCHGNTLLRLTHQLEK